MEESHNYTADTVFEGTNGVDYLYNHASGVTIEGGGGDDAAIVNEVDGNNVVMNGGDGNDNIENYASSVTIYGGAGDDTINNNIVYGGGSNVKIYGEDGNDYIINLGDNVTIDGGTGDDTITNVNSNVTISGGTGNDSIFNGGSNVTITGGYDNDYIIVSGSDNVIQYANGDGNDTVEIYSGATFTLQIDYSGQPTSVNSGNNLVVKVGEGSITFLDMASQSLNIIDTSGNAISLTDNTDSTDTDTSTETTDTNTTLLQSDTDIVFLVDTSESMGTYIERVRNALNSFADSLSSANVSYRLGLVDFGYSGNDSSSNYVKSYSFVEDAESFKNELANLSSDDGIKEYGLTAIDTALSLDFREEATKRFVMLTDEGYEENNRGSTSDLDSDTVLAKLADADVILDVVGEMNGECQNEYEPIANATGGKFYDINLDSYDTIFEEISGSIVDQIGQPDSVAVNLNDVAEGEAGVFLLYSTTDENGSTTFSSQATFISMGFTPYKYNGHYYGIYTNQSSWEDAKTFCENLGGHLVTITDESEQIFVKSLLENEQTPKNSYWMGGYKDSSNEWTWITGETWNYSSWGNGQPDGDGEALMMYCSTANGWELGDWNDFPAEGENGQDFFGLENFGFICEWDIGDIEDFQVVGTVTNEKVYAADTDSEYRQSITVPAEWNVTATENNDRFYVTGNNATVAGGDGKDSFTVGSDVDGIIFADIDTAADKISFAASIPENSLEYSVGTALELYSDDISLTFQNRTALTADFATYSVSNGGTSNTISELLINPPNFDNIEVNSDASVIMSFAHWSYGFEPADNSSAS